MSSKKRDIPAFGLPIIETHCHLDYLKQAPLDEILTRAGAVGVERVVTISVAPDNLDTARSLAAAHPQVWCSQGVHPHDAEQYSDAVGRRIRAALSDPKVLAVGEIGLDYYYDHSDRAVQRRVFEQQLQIAADAGLPVIIHSRDADDDTRSILSNFIDTMPRKGVIHSFTSGLALAEFCVDAGFCLGFNGICTFNKADNVRQVIRATPAERILLETDAPFLTPVPYRGRENAPCYLPFIAEKIAALKHLSVEKLLQQTYRNSLTALFAAPA